MSEITRVALDAMGGDNAPVEIIQGGIDAINERDDIHLCFCFKIRYNY